MTTYLQDPSEVLTYSFDFTPGLEGGATIAAHQVTVGAGMTVVAQSRNGAVVTARLSGGVNGGRYALTWQATDSTGQVFERSDQIWVNDL